MVKPEVAQLRAVAKQMIRMEQIHRERLARIESPGRDLRARRRTRRK
jgi:hypothetical protein